MTGWFNSSVDLDQRKAAFKESVVIRRVHRWLQRNEDSKKNVGNE